MKAYLIDPVAKTVTEVKCSGHMHGADGIYAHIRADYMDIGRFNREGDHVYVDDDGWNNGALHKYGAFVLTHGEQSMPFVGYGLVLGSRGEYEADPRISLDDMRKMVSFPTLDELRRAAAAGIYDR